MTLDEFWTLIEQTKDASADIDERTEVLRAKLSRLSTEDVAAFDRRFTETLDRAYSHDLWGAAYIIQGGCSDDAFWDFRSVLISMGKDAFERAIRDPDSLASLSAEDLDELYAEGFQYVAGSIYEERTGVLLERSHPHPPKPVGEKRSDDPDELRKRWPKLFAKHWEE
ncbi:DUF4240 domain-containing protein [Nibricoccus aquaticus]|nr:DUF4240 domain-containing protein [Nibricoccus aquaticus]